MPRLRAASPKLEVMKTLVLVIISLMLAGAHISAQTAEQWPIQQCVALSEQSGAAADSESWQTVVTLNVRKMMHCSEFMSSADKAAVLNTIGTALYRLERNEEAVTVLQKCVSLYPQDAGCWLVLAWASEDLGRISDARKYYQKCISAGAADGAADEVNAISIMGAREGLANLDRNYPNENAHNQTRGAPAPQENQPKFGTGFFVNNAGYIITNNHVVAGCRTLAIRNGRKLQIVARDQSVDLALLKADVTSSSVAVFRGGTPPKLGEGVVVFGFPLPGILSSEGNVTTVVLSATSGLDDDVRMIQITAPVQPGNCGGPVFDASGHVIGVVVSKLDVIQMAKATGDIAQNVNFAVHWAAVRSFLDEQGVRYRREASQVTTPTPKIAELASEASVALECTE